MNTINKKEIEKFSKIAAEWWNPNGKFKPLHKFNPIRIKYIKDNIIKKFADVFEYVGRDEAYLDVSEKVEQDFVKAGHIAQQIKNEVREKTKLTCSVGISPNKLLSKIASGYKKPDGLTTVTPDKISEFMETLNLGDIHGIGKKTVQNLVEEGIETISQAKSLDIFILN